MPWVKPEGTSGAGARQVSSRSSAPRPSQKVLEQLVSFGLGQRPDVRLSDLLWALARIGLLPLTRQHLRAKIREVPDFPKPGILFYDITTLLKDAAAYKEAIDLMLAPYSDERIDIMG